MPPFNRSNLTYSAAQTEVAGSAGVGTTEMLARAGNSLDAVAQKWNRMRWKFLAADQIIGLVGPFTVSGCSTTQDSTTVTTTTSNGFLSVLADDVANGAGIRLDTLVSATGATSIVLAASASATVTGATLTFNRAIYPLASDFKKMYDLRILGRRKVLYYQNRRLYDRMVADQSAQGEPWGYDVASIPSQGKIRIVNPPDGADTLWLRYYRRITMPSLLASATGLDIPEDYEDIFIADAKAHFLADKAQSHREQWLYWRDYADKGIKQARADERIEEDENLAFQPPLSTRVYGVNSPYYFFGPDKL